MVPRTDSAAASVLLRNRGANEFIVLLPDGAALVEIAGPSSNLAVYIRQIMSRSSVVDVLTTELSLTRKQAEVAYDVVGGISKSAVGREKRVTVHTIRRHTEAVYAKLQVRSLADLEMSLSNALMCWLNEGPRRT
jgi:DNA-binding NarL/FixJ family response regulator